MWSKILLTTIIFVLGFIAFKTNVNALCFICNSCMSSGCTIAEDWWCIERGNGYECVGYGAANNNCRYNYWQYDNGFGNSNHYALPGSNTCGNSCMHRPSYRSCNELCAASDTCTGGTSCINLGGNFGYCRNPSCSSESDCTCNTATNTPTPRPTQPPCSNISLSVSAINCNNQVTLTISGFNSSTYNFISDSVNLPGPTVRPPSVTSVTRTISGGTTGITWRHEWRECVGSNCSNTCSRTYSGSITPYVAPQCNSGSYSMVLSSNPNPIYTDLNFNLNSTYNISPASSYRFISDSYSTNITCNAPAPGLTMSRTCSFTDPTLETAQAATWTHTWDTINPTCSNITRRCTANLTVNGQPNPGYVVTRVGTSYVRGNVEQLRFNTADDFSSAIFGSATNNLQNHRMIAGPDCASGFVTCSSKGTNFIQKELYDDINYRSDWFDHYKGQLFAKIGESDRVTYNDNRTYGDVDLSKKLIYINGANLTIPQGTTCSGNRIFLIENGNLNISPPFKTANDPDSACLFIVESQTNILAGIDGRPTSTSPYTEADLDRIDAFIITNRYADSDNGNDLLVIKGGVIVQTNAQTFFRRAIGNSNTPSTILHYEGGRYIKHFGEVLSDPNGLIIRETQYANM